MNAETTPTEAAYHLRSSGGRGRPSDAGSDPNASDGFANDTIDGGGTDDYFNVDGGDVATAC